MGSVRQIRQRLEKTSESPADVVPLPKQACGNPSAESDAIRFILTPPSENSWL